MIQPDSASSTSAANDGSRFIRLVRRIADVRQGELAPALSSCLYFFCLMAAYYVIRPIRDEMGIRGGTKNLPWLFIGTLAAMLAINPLFSLLVSRYPRRRFIPLVYRFFELNLLIFILLLRDRPPGEGVTLARVFFIWTSVFNLFVVAVFWGLMADRFNCEQGKRIFAFIGLGGTLGAIAGSAMASGLATVIKPVNLLWISIVLLEVAVWCVRAVVRRSNRGAEAGAGADPCGPLPGAEPAEVDRTSSSSADLNMAGGGWLGGIAGTLRSPYLLGICCYILLYSIGSTFVYFEQANMISATIKDSAQRTAFFGRIDLFVNILTLTLQAFVAGRLIDRFGVPVVIALLPTLTLAGFASLAAWPALAVLFWFQVLRRAAAYALARPSRELLFTVVRPEDKYKAKSLIDTAVYRAGDAAGASAYGTVAAWSGGASSLPAWGIGLCGLWIVVSILLGVRQQQRARTESVNENINGRVGRGPRPLPTLPP